MSRGVDSLSQKVASLPVSKTNKQFFYPLLCVCVCFFFADSRGFLLAGVCFDFTVLKSSCNQFVWLISTACLPALCVLCVIFLALFVDRKRGIRSLSWLLY